jgi:hypothetical protein
MCLKAPGVDAHLLRAPFYAERRALTQEQARHDDVALRNVHLRRQARSHDAAREGAVHAAATLLLGVEAQRVQSKSVPSRLRSLYSSMESSEAGAAWLPYELK